VSGRLWALRAVPELAGFSDSELASLLPYFDEVSLPAGRRLAFEGRVCSSYLIVLQGRLCARSASGESSTLDAGDSFGWDAMWERGFNEATVVVGSDARVLVMGHAQFRAVKALGRREAEPSDPEVGLTHPRIVA
jgi:CRP-like cAMP-binding protein